jgi:formylglycine-generating enzyme required for sulfatase activity
VKSVKQPASPLGRLRTAGQRLTVTLQTGGRGVRVLGRELVGRREERISLPEGCSSLVLETAASRLELERVQRPAWAEKFWQDGFGLAAEFEIGGVKFVMRWIPPGRFLMGSPEGELGRRDDEGPQHEVTITRGYWMGETPVTQAQWRAVEKGTEKLQHKVSRGSKLWHVQRSVFESLNRQMSERQSTPVDEDRPQCPRSSVSWNQSVQFVSQLGELLSVSDEFRLPTEAEWECACRAGTQGAYCDGSACTVPKGRDPALDRLAWFDENSGGSVQPVKQKGANGWGLYDVHGNVWEWCRDGKRVYGRDSGINPCGPAETGAAHVLRGGSWYNWAWLCRAASRSELDPALAWYDSGLRLSAGQRDRSGGAGPERAERVEEERL